MKGFQRLIVPKKSIIQANINESKKLYYLHIWGKKHEDFFDQPRLPYTYTTVDSGNKHHRPAPDSSSDCLDNELLFFHCFVSTA